jgi:hypothetical protein
MGQPLACITAIVEIELELEALAIWDCVLLQKLQRDGLEEMLLISPLQDALELERLIFESGGGQYACSQHTCEALS